MSVYMCDDCQEWFCHRCDDYGVNTMSATLCVECGERGAQKEADHQEEEREAVADAILDNEGGEW